MTGVQTCALPILVTGSVALAALLVSTDAGVTGFGAVAALVVAAALVATVVSAGLHGRGRAQAEALA